jgi:nucleoside-diphosphate-sugar epimerase
VIPAALAGKTATVLGDPDQPHTYTYLPDIGEGLAVLGEHPDAPGEVWHLPNDPHTRTTRQLVDTIYQLAGQPKIKLRDPVRAAPALRLPTSRANGWMAAPEGAPSPPSPAASARERPRQPPRFSTPAGCENGAAPELALVEQRPGTDPDA